MEIKPIFGKRFSFPENTEFQCDNMVHRITEKMVAQFVDGYDDYIVSQIANTARENGISDLTVLNKKAILDALNKQIPKKPTFVDTRFRSHGRHIGDGVSLDKCYKCPTCWSHIFHIWDSEKYCVHCGQALDWSEDNA